MRPRQNPLCSNGPPLPIRRRPALRRLTVALVIAASTLGALAQTTHIEAGQNLGAALEQVRRLGVDLIFSDRVVTANLQVERAIEVDPSAPQAALVVLLDPHGLVAELGPGGRWVIRPAPKLRLRGFVVDAHTGAAITGARVVIMDLAASAETDAQGRFQLDGLRTGSYRLFVEADGYPSRQVAARISENGPPLRIPLARPVVPAEEIVVTPSHHQVSHTDPGGALELGRRERDALPVPGDDVFRAMASFAGTAASDFSAAFHARGGRDDEVLVLLDGIELYEPYHLKDLGGALSIVAPQALEAAELRLGGFSATHGDKIAGLLDLRTVEPTTRATGHVGLSPVDLSGTWGDATANGRWSWFGSVRRGLVRETVKLLEGRERPAFSDGFAKLEWQPRPRHRVSLRGLEARDDNEIRDGSEFASSTYRTSHLWAGWNWIPGDHTVVESQAFYGRIDERRDGSDTDVEHFFTARDLRLVDVIGLQQRWNSQLTTSQSLKWGGGFREIETIYDYTLDLDLRADPVAGVRSRPASLLLDDSRTLHGDQGSAYLAHRISLDEPAWLPADGVTFETGLRFEESHAADDEHVSPRLLAAVALGTRSVLRLSWGAYYQSLRSHELQIEDGEEGFPEDERARKTVIGLDHRFRTGLSLRSEFYERRIEAPRVRHLNLFENRALFPETSNDRVRIAPFASRARGLEFEVSQRLGRSAWSAAYALSRTRDTVDLTAAGVEPLGGLSTAEERVVSVPRLFDQTHALKVAWDWSWRRPWDLHVEGSAHTGWPISRLALDSEEGEPTVRLVGLNDDRLPTYVRVDVRLQRRIQSRWGEWTLYADVLNLFDRNNRRGYEFSVSGHDGSPELERESLDWAGRVPVIGARLRF